MEKTRRIRRTASHYHDWLFIDVKTYHTKECLILAGSLGMDGEIGNADIIPTGTIISIENLDE